MEKLDIAKLEPDPLAKAQAEAEGKTIRVSGYVRSVDPDTISIAKSRTARSYVEYPRASVVAAFKADANAETVTILVKSEAKVRRVTNAQADEIADATDCGCSGSGTGYLRARPYGSISPLLAAWEALRWELLAQANQGLSGELACGELRADCFRRNGTREECDGIFDDCMQSGLPPVRDRY